MRMLLRMFETGICRPSCTEFAGEEICFAILSLQLSGLVTLNESQFPCMQDGNSGTCFPRLLTGPFGTQVLKNTSFPSIQVLDGWVDQ